MFVASVVYLPIERLDREREKVKNLDLRRLARLGTLTETP